MDEEMGGSLPGGDDREVKECNLATEMAGWLGSAAIIVGYAHNWDKLTYFVLNASGGVALMGYSFKRKVYQPFLLNAVWTGISIYRFISDTI
jgi:hypothetical protein